MTCFAIFIFEIVLVSRTDRYKSNEHLVINVSGRGDKDINTVATIDVISLD